ncbi:radical SAM protein [Micromonospora sonneratiae]
MGYIATYAAANGFNVGVLDGEALGLTVSQIQQTINRSAPRWAGFNLLAPTYELSATIASGLDPSIEIMVGGHQAKAMPHAIIDDPRFDRLAALVVGEGESRVVELLKDRSSRSQLPGVMWRDRLLNSPVTGGIPGTKHHLAPDINALPFVDRRFFAADPYPTANGVLESAMVGARGCPYDCTFCGAAVSANPDITIRTRDPINLVAEMDEVNQRFGVTAFRFVDDLFLGYERFIRQCMAVFSDNDIGERYRWDATGRINILARADEKLIATLVQNGCREIALGVESGSERVLRHIGKRITPELTRRVVRRLTQHGINIKGYFILGLPTETRDELDMTVRHIQELWAIADANPGSFRASVFEFRPYPGTPEWNRLMMTGRYDHRQLLDYSAVDLTTDGLDEALRERDEFNFSVNIQFGEAELAYVRHKLVEVARQQHDRR